MSNRSTPMFSLVIVWILFPILLVFAAQGAFSFESASLNAPIAATSTALVSAFSAQQSLTLRLQSCAVYLACILVLGPLIPPIWYRLKRTPLILLLLMICVLSALWSFNVKTTIVSTIYLLANAALAVFLVERFNTYQFMKLLVALGVIALVASVAVIVMFPEYGIQSRSLGESAWQGIFNQKNTCGAMFAILLIPVFYLKKHGLLIRAGALVYAIAALFVIYMSHSAGAIIITLCCLVFILALYLLTRFDSRSRMAIVMAGFLGVTVLVYLCIQNSPTLLLLMGKDSTLTGRTVIWERLLLSAMKRPFLGYGLSAFWQGLHGESGDVAMSVGWTGIGYAENGLLELWLQLGAVGSFLYVAIFVTAVRDAVICVSRKASPAVMWCCTMLFYVFVSNLEGGKLVAHSDLSCIIPLVVYMTLRKEAESIKSETERPTDITEHLSQCVRAA